MIILSKTPNKLHPPAPQYTPLAPKQSHMATVKVSKLLLTAKVHNYEVGISLANCFTRRLVVWNFASRSLHAEYVFHFHFWGYIGTLLKSLVTRAGFVGRIPPLVRSELVQPSELLSSHKSISDVYQQWLVLGTLV